MKQKMILILCIVMVFLGNLLVAEAGSMEGAMITMSPDGMAFTTNAGDRNTRWYDKGYEISTGMKATLRNPEPGEHEYQRERREDVPVKSWKVMWTRSQCIHMVNLAGNQYHGVPFRKNTCGNPYYSGWLGYCADCGEVVTNCYFYMSEEVARSIKSLDLDKTYYYKCPHCDNLEQGVDLAVHHCKGISANRYFVRYNANFGSGTMEKSSHMVNNATEYEGRAVTPQTKLNLNTFVRDGYEFAGWNTKKDGSGKSYVDGATIYNLCMEENGSITLYAQWRKRASVLEIDPNGGSYEGKSGIQRITGYYNSEYKLDMSALTTPPGPVVHFDTMGGEPLGDSESKIVFEEWSYSRPFYGKIQDGVYQFLGEDGTTDRIVAHYKQEAIVLPEAKWEGHSFGGWYADKDGLIPVGQAGERFQPNKEITLYAVWVDLKLVAEDNYTANQGKGAVDLSWTQKDYQNKVYEVYQKREEELWKKQQSMEENKESFHVSKTIFYSGEEGSYTVPYTGFYNLQLTGAQGGNHGNYKGGRGGRTEATVYLQKGEKLEYIIGGQNGYSGGGMAQKYGNGGGYSMVSTPRLGILMIAGGGGGASLAEDGGAGGAPKQPTQNRDGESGEAGGGGGYYGGSSGSLTYHRHTAECNHTHTGTPNSYGGCYTKEINCGSKEIEFKVTHSAFGYGNVTGDGSRIMCELCSSYECIGHLTEYGYYFCKRCGNQEKYPVSVCTANTGYGLGCGEKDYICGLKDEQLIQSIGAEGGGNYVNQNACLDYREESGIHQGNGTLTISSKQLGVRENCEWKGVTATDFAAPEKIDPETVEKTAVSEHEIRVSFTRPEDQGTDYYHQVKSYDKATMNLMCESNITKNTLISQVVGYWYLVDDSATTEVNEEHHFLAEKGESPFLVVEMGEASGYLHIAAQDKAGNIGTTLHIGISEQDVVYWPLMTEKLLMEGDNVASAQQADTYYVKADGSSPIQLTLEGLLCGTARTKYQIDEADFVIHSMEGNTEEGILSILVPKRDKITPGAYTYPVEALYKKQTGNCGVEDASFTWVQRYHLCKNLTVKQKLLISENLDGKRIRLMPRVAATGEKETVFSMEERDILNSIYLIGDAYGPQITSNHPLDKLSESNLSQNQEVELCLEAKDTGSGLAQFYVEVHNWDNNMVQYYEDAELSGKIELIIEQGEPIFSGNFSVLVYAKDRVNNESSLHSGILSVGVNARIDRVLEPNVPIFKKGESGILQITSWGYVESVEIRFPQAFYGQDPSLNRRIVYEVPGYVKNETIPFVVPLGAPEGEMTIQVVAYKDGVEYYAEPHLVTLEIRGDVRDELRTRLR